MPPITALAAVASAVRAMNYLFDDGQRDCEDMDREWKTAVSVLVELHELGEGSLIVVREQVYE